MGDDKGMKKRQLLLVLVLIMFLNCTGAVYAVEGEENEEDSYSNGNVAIKIENLEDYRYSDSGFDYMIDILFSGIGDNFYFKGYKEDKTIESTVPHTPVYYRGIQSKIQKEKLAYNSNYFVAPYKVKGSMDVNLWSDYIDGGKFDWISVLSDSTKYEHLFVSARDSLYGKDMADVGVGVDSYGNIVSSDRHVLVPFFMNSYFIEKVSKDELGGDYADLVAFPLSDAMSDAVGKTKYDSFKFSAVYINNEGEVKYVEYRNKKGKIVNSKDSPMTKDEFTVWLKSNGDKIDVNKTKEYIKVKFSGYVKEFNDHFLEVAEEVIESGEGDLAYLGVSIYDDSRFSQNPEAQKKDLGGIIEELLTGGAGKYIKLTFASLLSDAYEEWFVDFASKFIFYTSFYEDSVIIGNIVGAYFILVIMFLVLYLMIGLFNLKHGLNIVEILGKALIILFICIVPIVTYPKVVDFLFNKATEGVTGSQVKSMFLLDRWALLSEENQEELNETLPFTLDREIRGSEYNYLVQFKTNKFTYDYIAKNKIKNFNKEDEKEYHRSISDMKDKRVSVYVDANHLIEYFKETEDTDISLFGYLNSFYPEFYFGLGNTDGENAEYDEYYAYIDSDFVSKFGKPRVNVDLLDPDYFESDVITASRLGKELYKYYEENEDIDLYERFNMLGDYMLRNDISNEHRESIIALLSDIPMSLTRESYTRLNEEDFNDSSEYDIFLEEKLLLETCDYGDILGLYDFLKKITIVKDDSDYLVQELRYMINNINRSVIDEYLSNIRRVDAARGDTYYDEEPFMNAERDTLSLYVYFDLMKYLGVDGFPEGLDTAKVESDVFIRSLVIPFKDMTPDNVGVNHAALYVGVNKALLTSLFFLLMLVSLFCYGLLKLITVSSLLLPLMILVFLWNYAIKDDFKSKAWYGALHIILVFALVHWGFLGLWWICTNKMNSSLANIAVNGRMSFFNTFTNCILVMLYFIVVLKKVLVPTVKTAVKNIGNLGGEVFFNGTSKILGGALTALGAVKLFGNKVDSKVKNKESSQSKGNKDNKGSKVNKVSMDTPNSDDSVVNDIDNKIDQKKNKGDNVGDQHVESVPGSRLQEINENDLDDSIYDDAIKDGLIVSKFKAYKGEGSSKVSFKNAYSAREAEKYFKEQGYNAKKKGKDVLVDATDLELEYLKQGYIDRLNSNKGKIKGYDFDSCKMVDYAGVSSVDGNEFDVLYNKGTDQILEKLKSEGKIDYTVNDDKARVKVNDLKDVSSIINDIELESNKLGRLNNVKDDRADTKFAFDYDNGLVDFDKVIKGHRLKEGVDYKISNGKVVSLNNKSKHLFNSIYQKNYMFSDRIVDGIDDTIKSDFVGLSNKKFGSNDVRIYELVKSNYSGAEIYDILDNLDDDLKERLDHIGKVRYFGGKLIIYADKNVSESDVKDLFVDIQRSMSK